MQTKTLISTLVSDLRPVDRRGAVTFLAMAPLGGAVISLMLVVWWLRMRPDLGEAVLGFSFWMKAAYTGWLARIGLQLLTRVRLPDADRLALPRLIAPPLVLLAAISLWQWLGLPAGPARTFWLGSNWSACPLLIVVLAVPIIAGAIAALGRFAPARPAEAGVIAGLLGGAAGATVYGLHCGETSAGFVLVWYSLGVAAAALVGGLVGARLLRW